MLGERLEGDSRFQRLLRSGLVCMCTRSMPVRPQSGKSFRQNKTLGGA